MELPCAQASSSTMRSAIDSIYILMQPGISAQRVGSAQGRLARLTALGGCVPHKEAALPGCACMQLMLDAAGPPPYLCPAR